MCGSEVSLLRGFQEEGGGAGLETTRTPWIVPCHTPLPFENQVLRSGGKINSML